MSPTAKSELHPATAAEVTEALRAVPDVEVLENEPLARYTRFGVGGPARWIVNIPAVPALQQVLSILDRYGVPRFTLGSGTNVIAPDEGYPGAILRYLAARYSIRDVWLEADAGVELQRLVDATIEQGLAGLENLTGIPGTLGAAIYGNAGAYGRSIGDVVEKVRVLAAGQLRDMEQSECAFAYRESIFKQHRTWIILWACLRLTPGDREALRARADEIRRVRDPKYPSHMKCAGSIFKNLLVDSLPEVVRAQVPRELIREGKVPAAYFLEKVGAKGLQIGGMRVADYHANLIYNTSTGTASELIQLITELKTRVRERFGVELEEEVQYIH